jgi:hypothetical protein
MSEFDPYKIEELRREKKITDNQYIGLLLEIATYLALRDLGIQPNPLHNPFDEKYVKDQHIHVDLIFIHYNLLYAVECKNLSPKWSWRDKDWVYEEVIYRFDNLEEDYHIDRKILVISHGKNSVRKYIPSDYEIIELGYQIQKIKEIYLSKQILQKKLKIALFRENSYNSILSTPQGYVLAHRDYLRAKQTLRYIERKLKRDQKRKAKSRKETLVRWMAILGK